MRLLAAFLILASFSVQGQDYFLEKYEPYNQSIPTPEAFLGYEIGFQHTRHDRIVDYLNVLALANPRAEYTQYGKTYEGRILGVLAISTKSNITNLKDIQEKHVKRVDPNSSEVGKDLPVIINLGYNVHGNEPSSSEAALLTAYILVASEHEEIKKFREQAVTFIDPTINPDGRDRHTQWVNSFKGKNLISDPIDIEHNEGWPRGRTNHYWFDLNRDWWLAIHPESRGKLNWYHQWYPNVVTDFHEMGTNSTYFFEPMKDNGSKDPIMPKENYTTLNDKFAEYYSAALDEIGSRYFTKEVFDGTYPGYGSSYPDLQGGLGILFEQASSRGHLQKTSTGIMLSFAFTIRNQLTSGIATVRAAVENKDLLFDYQKSFFKSAVSNASKSKIKAYVFSEEKDTKRLNEFLDKLLIHRVEFYKLGKSVAGFSADNSFVVPTAQPQYRMVQSIFETYENFTDSVFYDASAWSLANFYNIRFAEQASVPSRGDKVESVPSVELNELKQARNAYLIPWSSYNAPAVLNALQSKGLSVLAATKNFSVETSEGTQSFTPGTMMIPVADQKKDPETVFKIVTKITQKYEVQAHGVETAMSTSGVDLGSFSVRPLQQPKIITWVEEGVSSYEAGELWHLMDQRMDVQMTKVRLRNFNSVNLGNYNTMVMVSGSYDQLDSMKRMKIKNWVKKGNTLITQRTASTWAIKNKIANEKLVEKDKKKDEEKEEPTERLPWIQSAEIEGKKSVGGALFMTDLDVTHPLGFGYDRRNLPVYRNSNVWLKPSKNPYSNVAMYTSDPHIDGFITRENLEKLKKSASLIVSKQGAGRVILFAENPNFRATTYGTSKLMMNAIFFGGLVSVPTVRE